ncbi:hypothetical protein C7974DRAFT_468317 [Boeremia exigua]|uniref:uncharacterized protein n=1 Tax=Boeremia exigua TaxID=749465 RepID=UPI001E8D22E3|nr:uncharacterized protein C7974DRAFT_468317 [Boeremia exigua]KAH6644764.1 hypothetical protein C7974DRAFT_468317 [Boeremia exigua]
MADNSRRSQLSSRTIQINLVQAKVHQQELESCIKSNFDNSFEYSSLRTWFKDALIEKIPEPLLQFLGASQWYPGRVLVGYVKSKEGGRLWACVLRESSTREGAQVQYFLDTNSGYKRYQLTKDGLNIQYQPWVLGPTHDTEKFKRDMRSLIIQALLLGDRFDASVVPPNLNSQPYKAVLALFQQISANLKKRSPKESSIGNVKRIRVFNKPISLWRSPSKSPARSPSQSSPTSADGSPNPTPTPQTLLREKRRVGKDVAPTSVAKKPRLDNFNVIDLLKTQKASEEDELRTLKAQLEEKELSVVRLTDAARSAAEEKNKVREKLEILTNENTRLIDRNKALEDQNTAIKTRDSILKADIEALKSHQEREEKHKQAYVRQNETYRAAISLHRKDKFVLIQAPMKQLMKEEGLSEEKAKERAEVWYEDRYEVAIEPLLLAAQQDAVETVGGLS